MREATPGEDPLEAPHGAVLQPERGRRALALRVLGKDHSQRHLRLARHRQRDAPQGARRNGSRHRPRGGRDGVHLQLPRRQADAGLGHLGPQVRRRRSGGLLPGGPERPEGGGGAAAARPGPRRAGEGERKAPGRLRLARGAGRELHPGGRGADRAPERRPRRARLREGDLRKRLLQALQRLRRRARRRAAPAHRQRQGLRDDRLLRRRARALPRDRRRALPRGRAALLEVGARHRDLRQRHGRRQGHLG